MNYEPLLMGILAAFIALLVLYGLAYYLQLARPFPKTKLKQQLYQGGETVKPRQRRYIEKTFVWLSYFSTAHVISFMLITLLVLSIGQLSTYDLTYPILYFLFTSFAIIFLAREFPAKQVHKEE